MSLQEMNLQDSLPHQEIRILRPKTMNNKSSRVTRDNVGASKAKITMNIENPNLRTKKTKGNLEKIEVEEEGPKATLTLQENMARSRQIYLNRMKKKNQWKPNEAELKVVKSHYKMNKCPTKEEKLKIISILEETCQSKVELAQLSRWFQIQKEKKAKRNSDDSKNTYKKFSQEELLFLREQFSLNTYPKTEEMKEISQRLNVSLSKIENWYKHNRRSLAKKGFFVLKTKKYFKKEEINYLVTMFETYPRPSKEQVIEMARSLNCTESQIKNWYSNKRKKQKLVLKKQGSDKPETHFEEELAVKSCGSSKQSQECLSSPCSDIPTALNSSQSFSSFIQRKESMDADMKPNLKINKGFKHFFSHSSQEECLKEVQPLIIPKPQVSNIPLLKVRSNTFENLNFKVDEPQPLKDSSFKLNAIPKLSLDTSEPIKASLSRKSSAEILPSFKLNASAKINTDNISKLISPTNLSQLQNSLMSLSNKGSSAAASTQSSNLQNLLNNQNFLGKPQKLGSSYENLYHLKYLANLYYLNNSPLFNGFVNPLLMSNPDHLLQNIQNIPALQTRLDENTSKKTPVFNHSFLSRMKTTEKTAFNPRILDLDIEAKKF